MKMKDTDQDTDTDTEAEADTDLINFATWKLVLKFFNKILSVSVFIFIIISYIISW